MRISRSFSPWQPVGVVILAAGDDRRLMDPVTPGGL
jgi:hypothetical protein